MDNELGSLAPNRFATSVTVPGLTFSFLRPLLRAGPSPGPPRWHAPLPRAAGAGSRSGSPHSTGRSRRGISPPVRPARFLF